MASDWPFQTKYSATFALVMLGYGTFHSWIWTCHYRAFPAFRGSHPKIWTTWASHFLTMKRLWRVVTSPFRRLPDFYIIGAPKSGTSALYQYLSLHPQIKEPFFKETRFLEGMCGLQLSASRFRSMFPFSFESVGCLTFDADATSSLMPDLASAMMRRLTPNAKIILSCREPENGALSMYKFRSRIKGRHDYGMSFQQMYDMEMDLQKSPEWARMKAVAEELDRGASSVTISPAMAECVLNSSMLRGFHYAEIVSQLQKRFNKHQILLIKFEDIAKDTEKTVRRIFEFLGVDSTIPLPSLSKIQPEDVMDIAMGETASFVSDSEKKLLGKYFHGRNNEFSTLMGLPLSDLF